MARSTTVSIKQHGYKGAVPNRGEKAVASNRGKSSSNFKGNEVRNGHGTADKGKH